MGAKNSIISGPYSGSILTCIGTNLFLAGRRVTNLEYYQLITEKSKIDGFSAISRAAIGTYLLGPAGIIAGATAKHQEVYLVELKFADQNQESIAEVDEIIFQAILSSPKAYPNTSTPVETNVNSSIPIQNQTPIINGPANADALLKRGNMALEDSEWEAALAYFNSVLNLDAECGEAYFGIVKAKLHVFTNDQFEEAYIHANENDLKELKYAARFDSKIADYVSSINSRNSNIIEKYQEYIKKIDNSKHLIAAEGNGLWGIAENGQLIRFGEQSRNDLHLSAWKNLKSISSEIGVVGLTNDGTVLCCGNTQFDSLSVSYWKDIIAISQGGFHLLGLKNNGTVCASGPKGNLASLSSGQCNVYNWRNIIKIAAGDCHSIGLQSDGTVVATGMNINGQCNVSNWTDICDIAAGIKYTVGLKKDGTVIAIGNNADGQCNVSSWTDIISIYSTGGMTIGIKKDGTILSTHPFDTSKFKNIIDIATRYIDHGWWCLYGVTEDGAIVVSSEIDNLNKIQPIEETVKHKKLFYSTQEKLQAKMLFNKIMDEHEDEIQQLHAKIDELSKKRTDLLNHNNELKQMLLSTPATLEYEQKCQECRAMEKEFHNLGVFDLKKKKELQTKLDELYILKNRALEESSKQKQAIKAQIDNSEPSIIEEIKKINQQISSIKNEALQNSGYDPNIMQ